MDTLYRRLYRRRARKESPEELVAMTWADRVQGWLADSQTSKAPPRAGRATMSNTLHTPPSR